MCFCQVARQEIRIRVFRFAMSSDAIFRLTLRFVACNQQCYNVRLYGTHINTQYMWMCVCMYVCKGTRHLQISDGCSVDACCGCGIWQLVGSWQVRRQLCCLLLLLLCYFSSAVVAAQLLPTLLPSKRHNDSVTHIS